VLTEIFAGDEEAAGAASGVADNVLGLRAHQFDREAGGCMVVSSFLCKRLQINST
jgi:hypothetical protein